MALPSQESLQDFADRVPAYRERVDTELARWLDNSRCASDSLLDATRYVLLDGGKRIRPLLAYASGELLDIPAVKIDPIAAAVEMVHVYSLVHDDLPAMDDDELRRGRPTVHVAYDEATAILVGDALQALAFEVLTVHDAFADDEVASARLVRALAQAAGLNGMAGGQALDLAYSGRKVAQDELEQMFARKTGRLIGAAIVMPLEFVPGASVEQRAALHELAATIGVCFQIRDDILDVTRSTAQLGKPSGSDERNDRTSYPARFGLDAARARADELLVEALACFERLGPRAEALRWLTNLIATRDQ